MRFVGPVRNFYGRYERPISSFFLFFGFVLDGLTLKRVDSLFENVVIFSYLLIIGTFIILIHLKESEEGGEKNPGSAHFWYVNILQFAFGGVFSAFLVLYFRSADIFVAWPFIVLLLLTFIANEFLKKHYIRLSFQISLFFLSIFWFSIFLVPVILRKIGPEIFLLSGIVSLAVITLFILILFRFTKDKLAKSKKLIILLISSVLILVNFLYFTNLIPPIPLSLKDGGVYHSIKKTNNGYEVTFEDLGWSRFFKLYPDYNKALGEPVYAFSAVYSPKDLDMTIVHEWQRYDEKKKWVTESIVDLSVVGGRDGGFRTYSMRTNPKPGKWRVNVKTERGQVIGRLRFNVVPALEKPMLTTEIK